jgi:hypothetical protein
MAVCKDFCDKALHTAFEFTEPVHRGLLLIGEVHHSFLLQLSVHDPSIHSFSIVIESKEICNFFELMEWLNLSLLHVLSLSVYKESGLETLGVSPLQLHWR